MAWGLKGDTECGVGGGKKRGNQSGGGGTDKMLLSRKQSNDVSETTESD